MMDVLFFSIWRNKYLLQKIYYSDIDYYIIKNVSHLDKRYSYLVSLNHFNKPVVYHIKDLDHYHVYSSHQHKHLITHIIVSTHFYVNHYHIVQQQTKSPILFGLSITTPDDPLILATELPLSIRYFKYTTFSQPLTKEYVPQSLTSLYLDISATIDQIPTKIKTLNIDTYDVDDQNRDLKYWKLDNGNLPPSLTKLQFNDRHKITKFDFNLDEMPPNLFYLSISGEGRFKGNGSGSLKYYKLYNSSRSYQIPTSVTQLKIKVPSLNLTPLPPNLNHLEYELVDNDRTRAIKSPEKFPEKLTTLSIGNCYFKTINKDNCPPGLLYYKNWSYKIQTDTPYIPPSVTKLRLSVSEKMEELPVLPSSLLELKMFCFDSLKPTKPFQGYFPNTIVKLSFQSSEEIFVGLIPPSVTDLKLISKHAIHKGTIPNSVTKLHLIHKRMVQPIVIPNSVTYLTFEHDEQIYSHIEIPDSVKTIKVKHLSFNNFPFIDYFKTTFKNITRFSTHSILCISEEDVYLLLNKLANENLLSNLKQMDIYHSNYHIIDQKVIKKEDDHIGSWKFKNKYK
ncbi:hypothetical protein CYY_000100 [Polysphondylium violaceum]|uniref:FNIP repeat-containing protein n=1 Tax=Polysphondylium violaceum TaxID=133409 RepID=A0A8J4V2P8_9MYCE|nr:hypothetical protein CYY_000100 [Polysphondylium violaceum]